MKSEHLKARRGMTLVELLGVMVVLAILAMITIGSITRAIERSRVTKALTAIDGYRSSFLSAVVSHPSVYGDRMSNWGDGTAYSSKEGLKRAAAFMNDTLDDNLHFYWNQDAGYYETTEKDPWGGTYILTEYPWSAEHPEADYYDCSKYPGNAYFACSIWATGNNDALLSDDPTIADDSYGVCLLFADGIVTPKFNGFDTDGSPFEGYKLRYG